MNPTQSPDAPLILPSEEDPTPTVDRHVVFPISVLHPLGDVRRGEPLSAEELEREEAIQIRIAINSAPHAVVAGLVAVALVAWLAVLNKVDANAIWPWAAALVAFQVITGAIIAGFRRRESVASARSLRHFYGGIGLLTGSLWGSTSWLMLPGTPGFAPLLVTCMALVLIGGTGHLVQRLQLLAFVAPLTAVFCSGLLRVGGETQWVLAAAFFTVAALMMVFGTVRENTVKVAIRLGFKTEKLLQERTAQQLATDRARADAEAARAQAELANKSKNAFLAAAGHDLRQPMHALLQYVGQLQRRNRDAALDETIERAARALDSMQELLDSILEVSRLMLGAVRPSIEPVALAQILARLEAQVRPIAEDKGLEFVMSGDSALVETDPVLLERILRNLILNAIRYTDRGRVRVRCRHRSARMAIQVWDSGIGIARSEADRIFDEFYQVGNQARDRRKGLGLGLSIVRQLGALLAHPISLRSRPGKGSLFSVEVPLAHSAPSRSWSSARTPALDYVRASFVLLIDDNPSSLEATAQSLHTFGCRVVCAASSRDAVARLQRQECMPQLIVSDFRLEGETGLDAIRIVQADQKARFGNEFEIPGLVVSGDTAPEILEVVRHAGFPMLHKPLSLEALYAAVNALLRESALNG